MTKLFFLIIKPFKWVFKKIGQGLKYLFIDKTNKIFLVIIPNSLFAILGLSIVCYNFKSMKEDTTPLTNYGFAILVGLASVCFSWARGLTAEEDKDDLKKVTDYGESFFHCAIIFLLLSAIKYCSLHFELFIPKKWDIFHDYIVGFLNFAHTFGFTLGFYKVERVISGVNNLLYKRLHEE